MEESKKALLHRFVAGGAVGRLHAVKNKNYGEMMSMDIALPRNEKNWFEKLPAEIDKLIEVKLYYGHLFCHVLHQNYILKKGVDPDLLKNKILKFYDEKGAEYPAEHNVGHEYKAKPSLINFYKKLDPINVFNPGIGRTSKQKNWK
jgi:D-lactate dehydrogenase